MDKGIIYANNVTISGVIVHKYVTDKATTLTISTGRATKIPNYPKVVFFNELAKKADEEFELYDNVTILGNIQSSRRINENNIYYTQSIFGESIEKTPKAMEVLFGLDNSGEHHIPPKNLINIAGVITNIATPSKDLIRLNIRTVKKGRTSSIRAFYFTRDVGEVMAKFRVGDNICAIGNIQTNKKEKDGKMSYYENVVLRELEKVGELPKALSE